ncbi:ABC transporter ATP-binding protein [Planctellipticum variicoloris]|uniref:ABC transporter ATP-binding protein n=1 Tax=Planctellipticum variicoloris TaxID=3064265 RepID=UPI0030135E7E|nr:ABC transporter ATP-binding protein/permease [Planctomycetaceae bacterium SH412]
MLTETVSQSPAPQSAEVLEDLRTALVSLSWAAGRPCEPLAAGRVVAEAVIAVGASMRAHWSYWLLEAGRELDLRLRIADLRWHEVISLARYGATIVTSREESAPGTPTILVLHSERGRLRISRLQKGVHQKRRARSRDVARDADAFVRCVIYEPALTVGESHHHLRPFQRLLVLLKPERRDLGVALAIAACAGILSLSVPIAAQQLVRAVTFGSLYQPVIVLSLMMLALLGLLGCLQALHFYVAELLQRRLFARTVADLAWRLPRVRADVWHHHDGPELVNRFLEIATIQKVISNLAVDGLMVVLTTFVGMALMAFYHPYLLGYDILLIVLLVVVLFLMGRGAIRTSIAESLGKYKVLGWLEQLLRSRPVFQSIEGRDWAWQRADALCGEYLAARAQHFRILLRQIVSILVLQALAATGLLSLGGYLVLNEQLTLGQLVAAELIVAAIIGSFAKLGKHLEGWYDLMAALDKLGHLFDLPMEPSMGLAVPAEGGPLSLRIRNPPGTAAVSLPAGACIAIVEPNEAVRLRWRQRFEGNIESHGDDIELDGIPIGDLRRETLRSRIAIVGDSSLVADTIAINVHLHRAGVSDQDVVESLIRVGLRDRIDSLEDRLETVVVPEGWPLRPLEIRKLMLARALAGRPRLIVIDSWIDLLPPAEQKEILAALQAPSRTWTSVVLTVGDVADQCTHRLSGGVLQSSAVASSRKD